MDSTNASDHVRRLSEEVLLLGAPSGKNPDQTRRANRRRTSEDASEVSDEHERHATGDILPYHRMRASRVLWRWRQDTNEKTSSGENRSNVKPRWWLKVGVFASLLLALTLALMVIDSALALWKGGSLLNFSKFMRTNDPALDTRPNRKMFPVPATVVMRPPLPPLDQSTINIDETPNNHPPAWRLSGDPSHLKRCNKIMVFRFHDVLGWGAGLLFIARLHLIAARLGAVLLIDNGKWCYGRLEYYFEPYKINCVPPDDWYDEKQGRNITLEGWETAERIIANWDQLAAVDAYEDKIARADLDVEGMQRLNDVEFGPGPRPSVLPASETLPLPMVQAFEAQASVFKQYWKPLPETLEQVQEVKEMMGIGGPQPTVGVMIRLGDKGWEYRHSLRPSNVHNTFGNLSAHLEVMHDLYDRMIPPTSLATNPSKPWYPLSSSARLFKPGQQPIAIVVTAEETALLDISLESTAAPFQFDRTPSLKLDAGTYGKWSFLKLPMKMRVAHTRQLVRDIEIMAKYTDATVVTMSSNIGRIVTMLAGTEAALGPTDAQGNHVGGRIRALDVWWFPQEWPWLALSVVGWNGETRPPRRPGL